MSVRNRVAGLIGIPTLPGNILQEAEQIVEEVLAEAEIAEAGGIVVDAAIDVAIVVAAFVDAVVVVIAIIIILIILLLYFVVTHIAQVLGGIWVVGGAAGRIVSLSVGWVPNVAMEVGGYIDGKIEGLWHNIGLVIGYFAIQHITKVQQAIPPVKGTDVQAIRALIAPLQAEIHQLQGQVQSLGRQVYHTPNTPLPADIVTLPEQIQHLQAQVHTLYSNQLTEYKELVRITNTVNDLERIVHQTLTTIVGIRTVETGFQDILSQIQTLENQTRTIDANQSASIAHHTQILTRLSPLELLLEPGIRGLRNLRKLEDDPCQCPKFQGLGGDVGTMLAMYEFLTNG